MAKLVSRIIGMPYLKRTRISHERASLHISPMRDAFKVGGIDASSYTTEMVPFQTWSGIPNKEDVCSDSFPRVERKSTIPVPICGSRPEPTGAKVWRIRGYWTFLVDLSPKTLLRRFTRIHTAGHQNHPLNFNICGAIVAQRKVCYRSS